MPCDLHTHSVFSDGTCRPAELIDRAEQLGLTAIALCDHNSVSGLPDFMAAGIGKQVKAVPGIEFSTDYRGKELHILGLFVQPQHWPMLTGVMESFRREKEKSNLLLVQRLNGAGYGIDYESLKNKTPDGYVNRAHVAAELTRKGYTASIREAFYGLLAPGKGFYHPPKQLDSFETIDLIRSVNGVSVLAHPFLNMSAVELREFLNQKKPDAMETEYSTYDRETAQLASEIAREFGIAQSGGSDFHGTNKPDIHLGIGRGNLNISDDFYRNLWEIAKSRQ